MILFKIGIFPNRNLVGIGFGRLMVLDWAGRTEKGNNYWDCVCFCGSIARVQQSSLLNGYVRSCGCLKKTHGESKSRLYRIYRQMKYRCNNPTYPEYKYYGGRGITVCEEWEKDIISFLLWANTNGYAENLSIDRIDNDLGYSPDNCRWTTESLQCRNRSSSYLFTYKGEIKCVKEWSKEVGLSYYKLLKWFKQGADENIFRDLMEAR